MNFEFIDSFESKLAESNLVNYFQLNGKFQLPIDVISREEIDSAFNKVIEFIENNQLIFVAQMTDTKLLIRHDSETKQLPNQLIKLGIIPKKAIKTDVFFLYDGTLDLACLETPCIELVEFEEKVKESQPYFINLSWCVPIKRDSNLSILYADLHSGLLEMLRFYCDSCLSYWDQYNRLLPLSIQLYPIPFSEPIPRMLAIAFPTDGTDISEKSRKLRQHLHQTLHLKDDWPVFRYTQGLYFVPVHVKNYLVNPHENIGPRPKAAQVGIVKGRYTYKHYEQDNAGDRNWGCAYRSLQTLISWYIWQGDKDDEELPTLLEIQQVLVRIKDKPANFSGSKQWIGSFEVSLCLREFCGVDARIIHVPAGSQMVEQAQMLLTHFQTEGTPVMIGGGVLAHTILGVSIEESSVRFLILDPHYIGDEDLKTIIDKGYCGWKDAKFWVQDEKYNMCLPPGVRSI